MVAAMNRVSLTEVQRDSLNHLALVITSFGPDIRRLEAVTAESPSWSDNVATLRRAVGMAADALAKLQQQAKN